MHVLEESDRKIHVTGIELYHITDKMMVRCVAVSPDSTKNEILCIYPECANTLDWKTFIHLCTQLWAYNVEVTNVLILAGGKQYIRMLSERIFPLIFENRLYFPP